MLRTRTQSQFCLFWANVLCARLHKAKIRRTIRLQREQQFSFLSCDNRTANGNSSLIARLRSRNLAEIIPLLVGINAYVRKIWASCAVSVWLRLKGAAAASQIVFRRQALPERVDSKTDSRISYNSHLDIKAAWKKKQNKTVCRNSKAVEKR